MTGKGLRGDFLGASQVLFLDLGANFTSMFDS